MLAPGVTGDPDHRKRWPHTLDSSLRSSFKSSLGGPLKGDHKQASFAFQARSLVPRTSRVYIQDSRYSWVTPLSRWPPKSPASTWLAELSVPPGRQGARAEPRVISPSGASRLGVFHLSTGDPMAFSVAEPYTTFQDNRKRWFNNPLILAVPHGKWQPGSKFRSVWVPHLIWLCFYRDTHIVCMHGIKMKRKVNILTWGREWVLLFMVFKSYWK